MPVAFGTSTTATGNNVATTAINVPASTADGDMLLLAIDVSESVGVTPTVSGTWTQKARIDQVASGDNQDNCTILYWRRASSEPASYTITWDGTYGNYGAAHMLRYTGVIKSGDPFRTSVTGTGGTTPATSAASDALTGVQASDMAVHWAGMCLSNWNGTDHNPAGPGGGWTERGEIVATAATSTPSVLALEQLGIGTAPTFSTVGANVVFAFIAGALMEEPAGASASKIYTTAVHRASNW